MRLHALLPLCCGWPWSGLLEERPTDMEPLKEETASSQEEKLESISGNGTTVEWWLFKAAFAAFWESGGVRSHDGGSCDWFGVPGCPGRLRTDGGWIGYFADGVGVQAFGDWWPWVAISACGGLGTLLLGVLTYSVYTLMAPVRWMMRLCGRVGTMLGCKRRAMTEPLLPPATRVADDVEWHGPQTGWPTETRYLQYRLKGRGSRRRLNDVLVRKGGHVARLYQEENMLRRIDSNGLRVKFSNIAGSTSRQFRRDLEAAGEVHLCRQRECREEHALHILEFAGVDHDAIIDLHRYAHGSPRWLLGVLWRSLSFGLGLCLKGARCCCRRCWSKKHERVITDSEGRTRNLDPDSESEMECDEATCQGVKIGLIIDGEMRPLAPDGCSDMATNDETTLLDEDAEVSDVRPPRPNQNVRVPLCAHHKHLYQNASSRKKCGVLTCYKASKGAVQGVPLCQTHLLEQNGGGGGGSRADSPHPHGLTNDLQRRPSRRSSSRSKSPEVIFVASGVHSLHLGSPYWLF